VCAYLEHVFDIRLVCLDWVRVFDIRLGTYVRNLIPSTDAG